MATLNRPLWRLSLLLAALTFQAQAQGRSELAEHIDLHVDQTQHAETRALDSRAQAAQWGLTDQEWERYETLMQGRRGILSPGLDPLTALGVEARTDQERQRYAELQARFEYERIERELAYQRAYDEAIQRLAGNEPRISSFTLRPELSAGAVGPGGLPAGVASGPVRYDVIVSLAGCSGCDKAVQDLLAEGRAINVWVTDSGGDDARIRRWATDLGIPVERVTSGAITLNHGTSLNVSGQTLPIVRLR